jgi:hypothetical protein
MYTCSLVSSLSFPCRARTDCAHSHRLHIRGTPHLNTSTREAKDSGYSQSTKARTKSAVTSPNIGDGGGGGVHALGGAGGVLGSRQAKGKGKGKKCQVSTVPPAPAKPPLSPPVNKKRAWQEPLEDVEHMHLRLDTLQVLSSEFSQHTCSKYILHESPDTTMSEDSERMFTRLDALQLPSVNNISVVNTQDMCWK